MRGSFLIFLVFLIPCFTLQAQNSEARKLYREAGELFNSEHATPRTEKQAFDKYERARQLYLAGREENDTLADIYFNIGLYHQFPLDAQLTNPQLALEAYLASVRILEKRHRGLDSVFFKPYILIGRSALALSNYGTAEEYLEKANQIFTTNPAITNLYPDYEILLYNLGGVLYYQSGNYRQCINYFKKSVSILRQSKSVNVNELVGNSINIASSNMKLGEFQEALERYQGLLKYRVASNTIFHNIGYTYLLYQKYDSALFYLNKVQSVTPTQQVLLYNDLASTHFYLGNLDQAIRYYDHSIQLNRQKEGLSQVNLAAAYLGKGRVYEAQNQFRPALEQYQMAIRYLHATFQSKNIYANPDSLNGAVAGLELFEAFKAKAHAFRTYFGQTQKRIDLETALQTYQLAIQLADRIRKSYDSDDAKLFFTRTVFPTYEDAISTAFGLHALTKQESYLEMAFAFAEQSKAAVLAESLRDLEIKQIPGIDSTLLRQERELKRNLTAMSLRLGDAKDSTHKAAYQARIRDDEMELAQLVRTFEKNPQYYQLKYDTSAVRIAELQQKALDGYTALLEYVVGKDRLYVFVITRDGFEARQWPLAASFRHDLKEFQQGLSALKPGVRYQGDRLAYRLYQQLLQPLAATLANQKRLILVPDAELSYLPFEALVSEAASSHYLIEDFTLSYAYSGTLLHHVLEQPPTHQETTLLAMAPFARVQSSDPMPGPTAVRGEVLAPLPASRREVEQIGGKTYLAGEATKELFLQTAGSYGIIHLATHAQADNEQPLRSSIAFYPRLADSPASYRLYAQELYNLRLDHLKLVVLSACETGSGQLVRGEGVMSLARAFAYAGCPSIVTTFWKADDEATADITTRMHACLKAGLTKDESLRQAKLDYLRQQTDPRKRAPYYWANFVFIGDSAPLYAANRWWGWAGGGVVILVLLGWGFRRKLFYRG